MAKFCRPQALVSGFPMSRVVLSVEDDDAAYYVPEIAFRDLGTNCELRRTKDGIEALRFLRKEGEFGNAPTPDLILLNLNLPGLGGIDVLTEMQHDQELKEIPAVVFSSSRLDSDRANCLALGARHFIAKPSDYKTLLHAITTACSYINA